MHIPCFISTYLHLNLKDKRRESVLRDLARAQLEKIANRAHVKKFGGLTPEKRARLKVRRNVNMLGHFHEI